MLDVEGVLVDGRPDDGRTWTFSLESDLGIAPEILFNEFFAIHWEKVVVGESDLMDALSESLAKASIPVKAEDLVTYWFEMDSRVVRSVLDDCKVAKQQGIPLYLATNQEHNRASYLMETMGLNSVVNGIVYSAQAGCQKPQSEFFAFASRAVGFRPSELLLVDDTVANVEGARKAGWEAAHWDGSERLAEILRRSIR